MITRILSAGILIWAMMASSQVQDLQVEFRKGKTYITFTEEAGSGKFFRLYRSTSPITDVGDMAALVDIPDSSGYDKRYHEYHIITDSGVALAEGTGLFVYTPKGIADAYYAVTVVTGAAENKTLVAGENVLSAPVHEEYWQWPAGVLRAFYNNQGNNTWRFFYWFDYFDWNNAYDYYGDYYVACINGYGSAWGPHQAGTRVPLVLGLHSHHQTAYEYPPDGANNIGIGLQPRSQALPFNFQTWWYGWAKGWHFRNPEAGDSALNTPVKGDTIVNYAEMKIEMFIHAVINDPRFHVDTNRIYVGGASMGGTGTLTNAVHNPQIYAAASACVPAIKMEYCGYFNGMSGAVNRWGLAQDSLTARNGVNIWDWNDAGWVVGHNAKEDFPPFIISSGVQDGGMPLWMQRWFYRNCTKSRQSVFGIWENIGHACTSEEILAGGMYRFKRNEAMPVFTNASQDDNYGLMGPDTSIPQTGSVLIDSVGRTNGYLDWSSSLHRLALEGDSLIDGADSLRMTFVTSRESTTADITLRRVQRFPVTEGLSYDWKNFSTATGSAIASGTATLDTNGLLTVPSFLVLTTGSRLLVTLTNGSIAGRLPGISRVTTLGVQPNPFHSGTVISCAQRISSAVVFDIRGNRVASFNPGAERFSWNAAGRPAGIYMAVVKTARGETLRKRVILLK